MHTNVIVFAASKASPCICFTISPKQTILEIRLPDLYVSIWSPGKHFRPEPRRSKSRFIHIYVICWKTLPPRPSSFQELNFMYTYIWYAGKHFRHGPRCFQDRYIYIYIWYAWKHFRHTDLCIYVCAMLTNTSATPIYVYIWYAGKHFRHTDLCICKICWETLPPRVLSFQENIYIHEFKKKVQRTCFTLFHKNPGSLAPDLWKLPCHFLSHAGTMCIHANGFAAPEASLGMLLTLFHKNLGNVAPDLRKLPCRFLSHTGNVYSNAISFAVPKRRPRTCLIVFIQKLWNSAPDLRNFRVSSCPIQEICISM